MDVAGRRMRELGAAIELSRTALEGPALEVVLAKAVDLVAINLQAELAHVLELLPDGHLLVRAAVGLRPGLIGTAQIACDADPEAGCALASAQVVVYPERWTDTRVRVARFLVDHGAVSGMTVRLGERAEPFGVLAVHTTAPRRFNRDEVQFLMTMANVVSLYLRRAKAEAAVRESEERFRTYLEAAPDATVIVDRAGRIVRVNEQTERVFGYRRDELVGMHVEVLVPERLRAEHARDRATYMGMPRVRRMGADLELLARRRDGSEFPVDVSLSPLPAGAGVCAALRDVTDRKRAEEAARQLREFRRQQALEINDNVVQGLAVAAYALDAGDADGARDVVHHTLGTARNMMGALLDGAPAAVLPGDLVRARAASVPCRAPSEPDAGPACTEDAIRVVVADDTQAVRALVRVALAAAAGFRVVGEAADGEQAVEVCSETRPDVVLLDLAMPVLDGLEAIPLIRRASPGTRIVVLSGYGDGQVAARALGLGAHAYFEKGDLSSLAQSLRHVCARVEPDADLGDEAVLDYTDS